MARLGWGGGGGAICLLTVVNPPGYLNGPIYHNIYDMYVRHSVNV